MNKNEDLIYQLDTLHSHEPVDLDYPDFEVAYEDGSGADTWVDVCAVELAGRAAKRIRDLEVRLHRLSGILHGDLIYEYSDVEEMRELCNTDIELAVK